MSDLIDRQAAISALREQMINRPLDSDRWVIGQSMAIINKLPSAERTGRWTHVYDENEKLFFRNKWVCSECGNSNTYGMSDFCPCCGAMMENSTRRMKEAKE